MSPRRTVNPRRVTEEDELDRRIEHIIDTRLVVALKRRLDVFVDCLAERMEALMEARHEVNLRRNRVPNPSVDLEDVEEQDFDEDDEEYDKGYDENWKFDEFEGNDVGLFASVEYDEDDKEADAV
ncbi:hypothetical protein CDL15_Pgr004658 [Punica granatum]|uniref:PRP1 splicing factor N-terminal domain-containing protein n=1 Tax=Punica granatum TaxID=22663 RepID=A0A218WPF8_PUNGR|nr:hypothetical protein CDL15_Pgr004658 [Punica granatum]PKI63882.1 hypothetical protein CRG98_015718 [Punica granatum]